MEGNFSNVNSEGLPLHGQSLSAYMKFARGKHPNIRSKATKKKMAQSQIKNKHPWRQNYPI